jgi:hypothetical protein
MTITEQINEALRKYIHVSECSDECGWFAYFEVNGEFDDEMFSRRVNGCETPDQAIKELVKTAVEALRNMPPVE